MRYMRLCVAAFVCFGSIASLHAQQTTSSPATQATQLLQQSLAALVGNKTLTDVTLSGTARRLSGSDDESGTAVFKAISGAGRFDLQLSGGPWSEVENFTSTPAGTWSGPDGVSHAMAYQNLLTEPAWFFPAFAIARRLSTQGFAATYVGQETRNGQTVQHVSVSQTSSTQTSPGVPSLQHLSQVDFFLDSATLLPAAITFNIHPDNDMGLDLPVEIRFSDYKTTNGSQVPCHVQKLLNNMLILDLQIQTVNFNSGLSASAF